MGKGKSKRNKVSKGNPGSPGKIASGNNSSATVRPTAEISKPTGGAPPNSASRQSQTSQETKLARAFKPLQPEQMSTAAYQHIQECLKDKQTSYLDKEDVTAIVQLAQHLRVFGLLSAVGYIRHARDGKVRDRVRPMWTPLLWRLVCGEKSRPEDENQARQTLMNVAYTLSTQDPKKYMVTWRQSLKLSNHWNFWARACQKEITDEQRTEDRDAAG